MAQPHAASGQVVSVRPLGAALAEGKTAAILKAGQLELIRIVLPAGKSLREHSAPGEITVQCIEGRIAFTTPAATHELTPGDLIHLRANEPHALTALQDATALLTICLVRR
jgi:quercetin dioxygenase-like cupin family protein